MDLQTSKDLMCECGGNLTSFVRVSECEGVCLSTRTSIVQAVSKHHLFGGRYTLGLDGCICYGGNEIMCRFEVMSQHNYNTTCAVSSIHEQHATCMTSMHLL